MANNANTQRRTLIAFNSGMPKQQRAIKLLQQLHANATAADDDPCAELDPDPDMDGEEAEAPLDI